MEYQYVGLPLTSAIAAKLVIELFSGRTVKRQVIVDAVAMTHKSRGGADATAIDLPRTIKKGLTTLKKQGLCSNPSTGFWKIGTAVPVTDITHALKEDSELVTESRLPAASRIVGSGSGSVYVYFFPIYKHVANAEGRNSWPCKIGRSERDPILRVFSQSGTALPETPEIALLIKTDQAATLETALHAVLKLRGQWRDNSPGSEWFETNPEEIVSLLNILGICEANIKSCT